MWFWQHCNIPNVTATTQILSRDSRKMRQVQGSYPSEVTYISYQEMIGSRAINVSLPSKMEIQILTADLLTGNYGENNRWQQLNFWCTHFTLPHSNEKDVGLEYQCGWGECWVSHDDKVFEAGWRGKTETMEDFQKENDLWYLEGLYFTTLEPHFSSCNTTTSWYCAEMRGSSVVAFTTHVLATYKWFQHPPDMAPASPKTSTQLVHPFYATFPNNKAKPFSSLWCLQVWVVPCS